MIDHIAEKGIFLREYLDLKALSVYSSLGISTLRKHIRAGLRAYAVGGKTLVRRIDFDLWVENFRINSNQDLGAIADDVLQEIGHIDRR